MYYNCIYCTEILLIYNSKLYVDALPKYMGENRKSRGKNHAKIKMFWKSSPIIMNNNIQNSFLSFFQNIFYSKTKNK